MKIKLESNKIIQIILIILSLIQILFIKYFNYYLLLGILSIITIIVGIYYKDSIRNKPHKYSIESLLIILIYILLYYVITYFIGFFIGFTYTVYSKTLNGILYNIITNLILIICIETLRNLIITNSKYDKLSVYLTVITFTLLESTTFISFANISSRAILLQIIMESFLPCLSLNILLTYSTYKTNNINSFIIHMIMDLPIYLLPVFPNIGEYFKTLLLIIIPLVSVTTIHIILYAKYIKIKDTRNYLKNEKIKIIISTISMAITLVVIYFVSGIGRFNTYAIATPSMNPAISVGDAVIINKKDNDYQIGDIIAFNKNGKVIVHRITDIIEDDGIKYITKGDANNSEDTWKISKEDIIGTYSFKVKYIGWPTVKLSEFISK